MDISLIVSDLDGTLLGNDHATVPQRNVEALQRASQQGAVVAIATGRVWGLFTDIAKQVGCVRYAICSSGASILDVETGEWLHRQGLPWEQVTALFAICRKYHLPFEVYCDGENYAETDTVDLVLSVEITSEFMDNFRKHTTVVDNLDTALEGKTVEKIHVFHVPTPCHEAVLTEVNAISDFSMACGYGQNLELTPKGVTKRSALEFLSQRLGITQAQAMAFGDSGNDLEMLEWAEHSYAMANATDMVKKVARHQTITNEAGGVGAVVEEFF